VTEVGELAILRSSGQAATTQTTANTQEARDFKVVVTLDNPPADLRPGLSCTAKLQTAQKKNIVTIPIQAIAVRTERDIEEAKSRKSGSNVTLAAAKASTAAQKVDIQGVFVVRNKKVEFTPIQTGITGVTDIEVTSGLQEGDEIVTGSYKVLRTLKPGASIKIDNNAPKHEETNS
jgi:HlyD family secretion protein